MELPSTEGDDNNHQKAQKKALPAHHDVRYTRQWVRSSTQLIELWIVETARMLPHPFHAKVPNSYRLFSNQSSMDSLLVLQAQYACQASLVLNEKSVDMLTLYED